MIKKFCDKCGKELNGKPYFDVEATLWGAYGQGTGQYYRFDLCEDCLNAVKDFIEGNNKA